MSSFLKHCVDIVFRGRSHLFIFFLLLLASVVTFHNSFNNEFLLDDESILLNDNNTGSFRFLDVHALSQQDYYFRPLTYFFYYVHHILFQDALWKYHLAHLFWFWLSAGSFYYLMYLVFRDRILAFLPALLFCIHPLSGMMVNYKSAIGVVFYVFAMNMGLIHGLQALKGNQKNHNVVMGLVWFILALLSYEFAVVYPLYLAFLLWICGKNEKREAVQLFFWMTSVWFLYLGFCFFNKILFNHLHGNISGFQFNAGAYLAHISSVIFWYIQKLLFFNDIVLVWNAKVLVGEFGLWQAAFFAVLLACVYALSKRNRWPLVAFGLTWLIIGFLPVGLASFIRPEMGFIVEPQWLIYSSFGFFILLSITLLKISKMINWQSGVILFLFFAVAYIGGSWHYNYLWGTQERYCRYWLGVSPNPLAHLGLGRAYMVDKRYEDAKKSFLTMLREGIHTDEVYANLGICEYYLKNYQASLFCLNTIIGIKYQNKGTNFLADIYYLVGLNYVSLHKPEQARQAFEMSIKIDPTLIDAQRELQLLK